MKIVSTEKCLNKNRSGIRLNQLFMLPYRNFYIIHKWENSFCIPLNTKSSHWVRKSNKIAGYFSILDQWKIVYVYHYYGTVWYGTSVFSYIDDFYYVKILQRTVLEYYLLSYPIRTYDWKSHLTKLQNKK